MLYYSGAQDGSELVEVPGGRHQVEFSSYTLDVKFSTLKTLDDSTGVSVLVSPNSKSNILR